jgi:hypothetical protein
MPCPRFSQFHGENNRKVILINNLRKYRLQGSVGVFWQFVDPADSISIKNSLGIGENDLDQLMGPVGELISNLHE